MRVSGFDWDIGNIEKCQKHGMRLSEIEELFMRSPAVMTNDRHNTSEARLQAIGRTKSGRYGFVVFTFRSKGGKLFIRPISARFMHNKEIEYYERQNEEE